MNNFNQRQRQDGYVHHVPKNPDNNRSNNNNNLNNNNGNNYGSQGRKPNNFNSDRNTGNYNGNYGNNSNNNTNTSGKFNGDNRKFPMNERTDGQQNYKQNNYQENAPKIVKNILNNKFNDNINHDDDNDYLCNDIIKGQLLDYVYNTIELSNYKYKLLEYEYDLPLLKEKKYYVSPNYNGIHSLLIFIKIKDKFLSFIIDRRTLTYNAKQIDYNKVKIIPVQYRLDDSVYNGTIFDGVLLYNNIDGLKYFVINDVYYLRGKDTTTDKITNKMLSITTYLETIKEDAQTNNLIFIINKLYELKDIQQLVNVYIPKSKYSKSIKGISFYSEYSGTKLIYLYNNCSQDDMRKDDMNNGQNTHNTHNIHNTSNTSNTYTNNTYNKPQTQTKNIVKDTFEKEVRQSNVVVDNDSFTATFRMKKTDTVDVYNLYLGERSVENNKKLFKYKKIGIAYIPTTSCSYFCKDAISKSTDDGVLVDCKYDNDKKRWMPVKIVTDKKRPDLVEKIEGIGGSDSQS